MIRIGEKFETSGYTTYGKEYVEIFRNPTPREINEAAQADDDFEKGEIAVRFIANSSTRNIYVFPPTLLHQSAKKMIDETFPRNKCLFGVAQKYGRDWYMSRDVVLDSYARVSPEFVMTVGAQDWSWAEEYIHVVRYVEARVKEAQDTLGSSY